MEKEAQQFLDTYRKAALDRLTPKAFSDTDNIMEKLGRYSIWLAYSSPLFWIALKNTPSTAVRDITKVIFNLSFHTAFITFAIFAVAISDLIQCKRLGYMEDPKTKNSVKWMLTQRPRPLWQKTAAVLSFLAMLFIYLKTIEHLGLSKFIWTN